MEVRLVRFGQPVIPSTNYKYIFKLSPLRLRGSGPFLSKPTKNVSSVIFLFQSSLQGAPHLSVSASHHTIPIVWITWRLSFSNSQSKCQPGYLWALCHTGFWPKPCTQFAPAERSSSSRFSVRSVSPQSFLPVSTHRPQKGRPCRRPGRNRISKHWWFGDSSVVNAKDDNEWFFEWRKDMRSLGIIVSSCWRRCFYQNAL